LTRTGQPQFKGRLIITNQNVLDEDALGSGWNGIQDEPSDTGLEMEQHAK